MVEQVPFVGREDELSLIDELIRASGTQRVLCLDALGGIGKTRLLQEVSQRYTKAREITRLIVTNIIDFDIRDFRIPHRFMFSIAQMVGEEHFEQYFHTVLDWSRMEMMTSTPEQLIDKFLEVEKAFIECFNNAANQRRAVLLVDTFEAIEGTEMWNFLLKMIPQLNNTMLVIAGRRARLAGKALQAEMGRAVLIHSLQPLSEKASGDYLQKKQDLLKVFLDSELIRKILFLAGGRPILIDLTLEWLTRQAPLDWLIDSSFEEIQLLSEDSSNAHQKMFERQLVEHIVQSREPLDWLFLIMSRIYPLDIEMISKMLPVSIEEAQALFEEAKEYVFVKQLPNKCIMLHDEMQRLVNEYAWPEIDPDADRKRRDSKLAVECLDYEIQTLTERVRLLEKEEKTARENTNYQAQLDAFLKREPLEREIWVLKGQLLNHLLFLDLDMGVKTFAEMFDEASQTHRFLREILLAPMYHYVDQLAPSQRYEIESRRVIYWLDKGELQQAEGLVTELLAEANLAPDQQIDMLIQRGNLQIRSGHLNRGWSDLDKAVQISQEHDLQNWLVRSLNGRGWAYRVRGNFDRALADYLEAYKLSLNSNDRKRTAWILNNMAYVNAFKGNRTAAFKSCEAALEIWNDIDFPRGKGATYSNMGEISRWLDELSDSMVYYTKALDIFTAEDDLEWISRVRCGRAAVFRVQGELEKAQEDLDYAFENGPLNIRPQIFYERAKITWLKQDFVNDALQEARLLFQKCRQESQAIGETFYDYMSFADLIELAWELGDYAQWSKFADEYNRLYSNREDEESSRLSGSCLRKMADLAFCDGAYDDALRLYQKALPDPPPKKWTLS